MPRTDARSTPQLTDISTDSVLRDMCHRPPGVLFPCSGTQVSDGRQKSDDVGQSLTGHDPVNMSSPLVLRTRQKPQL